MAATKATPCAMSCKDYDPPVCTTGDCTYVSMRLSHIRDPTSEQLTSIFADELNLPCHLIPAALRQWATFGWKKYHHKHLTKKAKLPFPDVTDLTDVSPIRRAITKGSSHAHRLITAMCNIGELGYSTIAYPSRNRFAVDKGGRNNSLLTKELHRLDKGVVCHLLNKVAKLVTNETLLTGVDHLGWLEFSHNYDRYTSNLRIAAKNYETAIGARTPLTEE